LRNAPDPKVHTPAACVDIALSDGEDCHDDLMPAVCNAASVMIAQSDAIRIRGPNRGGDKEDRPANDTQLGQLLCALSHQDACNALIV